MKIMEGNAVASHNHLQTLTPGFHYIGYSTIGERPYLMKLIDGEYWEVWRGLLAGYRVPFGGIIGYSKRRNRFEPILGGLLERARPEDQAFINLFFEEVK